MPTPQDNQIQGATRPGPNLPIGSKDKSVGWYDPPITEVSPAVRDLLEVYAGIPAEEVIPRILEVRDTLWDIFPWPCVGQFRFLSLSLSETPSYERILSSLTPSTSSAAPSGLNNQASRTNQTSGDENTNLQIEYDDENKSNYAKSPRTIQTKTADITQDNREKQNEKEKEKEGQKNKILDIGCLLAPSLRKLARDGADPSSLYGLEIEPRFFEVGYDLFGDRSIIPEGNFVCGDVFGLFRDDDINSNFVGKGEEAEKENQENQEREKERGEGKRLYQAFKTINLSMILHIFPLNLQTKMCAILAAKLLRQERGVMVVGQCVGDLRGREVLIASSTGTGTGTGTGMGMMSSSNNTSNNASNDDDDNNNNNNDRNNKNSSSNVNDGGGTNANDANSDAKVDTNGNGGSGGGIRQNEKEEEDEKEDEKEIQIQKREKKIFKHNPETFSRMWQEVGILTGSKWEVVHCVLDFFGDDDHDVSSPAGTGNAGGGDTTSDINSDSSGANYVYHNGNSNYNGEDTAGVGGDGDADEDLTRDGIQKKGGGIQKQGGIAGIGDGDGIDGVAGGNAAQGRTGKRKGREWDEDTTRRLRFELVRVE